MANEKGAVSRLVMWDRLGRPCFETNLENVARVRRLIDEDPRCTYERIDTSLDVGSATERTILNEPSPEESCVLHRQIEFQKAERVKICRETLYVEQWLVLHHFQKSNNNTTYIPFYDVLTRKESRV